MTKSVVVVVSMGLVLAISSVRAVAEESEKGPQVKIPDTAAAILTAVKQHEDALGKLIAAKSLDKVHEEAFAIRDLVNALPGKSTDLGADKLDKVKANAKYVTDLATRLDESGDKDDQAGTEANFKKLQGVLKTIASLYQPAPK